MGRVRQGGLSAPLTYSPLTSVLTFLPPNMLPHPTSQRLEMRRTRDSEPLGLDQALAVSPEPASERWGGSSPSLRRGWQLAAGGRGKPGLSWSSL